MTINVHIERLVLEEIDLPRRARRQLQAAVETELARLLADGALAPDLLANRMASSMRAGSIRIATGGKPDSLGRQIARALHGSIGRAGTAPESGGEGV